MEKAPEALRAGFESHPWRFVLGRHWGSPLINVGLRSLWELSFLPPSCVENILPHFSLARLAIDLRPLSLQVLEFGASCGHVRKTNGGVVSEAEGNPVF